MPMPRPTPSPTPTHTPPLPSSTAPARGQDQHFVRLTAVSQAAMDVEPAAPDAGPPTYNRAEERMRAFWDRYGVLFDRSRRGPLSTATELTAQVAVLDDFQAEFGQHFAADRAYWLRDLHAFLRDQGQ
ncbi:unnamed protein product [Parajaminaea phylloscopi]